MLNKTIFFVVTIFGFQGFAQNQSPNMNLPVPVVGVTTGPQWASDINSSLGIIDAHDHSPGKGVQINPQGLNINSDLTCNSNNIISIRSSRYTSQSGALSGTNDLDATYVVNGDLWYNSGAGNQVQITSGGSVVGSPGTITGLPSGTASASYSSGSFIFQSATNTSAIIDGQSYILRNNVANSKGLTLNPPNSMAANYSLYLPVIPSILSFLTIDTSGNISGTVSSTGGITGTNIASATITGSNIASATITGSNIASSTISGSNILNNTISASNIINATITGTQVASNTITPANLTAPYYGVASSGTGSLTISGSTPVQVSASGYMSTTGKPILVHFQPDGSGYSSISENNATNGFFRLDRVSGISGVTTIAYFTGLTSNQYEQCSSISFIDTAMPANSGASNRYVLYGYTTAGTLFVTNCILLAVEL